ncbi:hypothetical protein GUJ93_ZPchr0005g16212 [Zizania palustris]|uniref:DUF3741 domain-containing protein n=1 Tax=Zizania palustris TaxID=103762 RepID=A0A8J5SLW0_ZIZPA|nr:hypothetical protein GUJ93_ZPchr0005g16212 [Zizania palustris]
MASSTFALDFLRRLLCAHSAGGGNVASAGHDTAAQDSDVSGRAGQSPAPPGGAEARSPCVVARLMGLDAMPPADSQLPLRRSRSASSAEGWSPLRTEIRASPSLREKPAYLREENDEFLILSFSPEARHDNAELFLLASGSDGKRRDDGTKKQSRHRRKLQYGCDDEEAHSSGHGRTTAAECGLQNASPVSVLDAQESSSSTTTTSCSSHEVEPCSSTSEEIRSGMKKQHGSRRKLQPDLDDHLDNLLSPATSPCHVLKCSDRERTNRSVLNKDEVFTTDVPGTLQLICRLVEEDLNSMRWLTRDFDDIAADIESEILDWLVWEETEELMQTSSETVNTFPGCFTFTSMKHQCSKTVQHRRAIGGGY